jgi:hypothetical protein
MVSVETMLLARWSRVPFLVGAKDVHTSWEVHPAYVPGFFPKIKAAGM